MATVAVIDYGMGNLHSIEKALKTASAHTDVIVSADKDTILSADRVVFPGVGAIRDCMNALHNTGLDDTIKQVAKDKPLLGICIGMQALLQHSEENGGIDCLGILPGNVVRFPKGLKDSSKNKLKIPHMGWNEVNSLKENPLFKKIGQDERFYFVHSYYVDNVGNDITIATSKYPKEFPCALRFKNIVAVQFHPEKSQHAGLQLLTNFLNWDGQS
ncbi:MAG: imidazole glycerol phosphate synthase subunit HisH [Cycloclasticus sp.]|nr:imidazole glycerol phosphate synthase subunit HisH [Cycloclasticus sp.]MBQ0789092.1 imidazole glycerol phosphate synthase subunit HisH [Cycloclasticus sp.]